MDDTSIGNNINTRPPDTGFAGLTGINQAMLAVSSNGIPTPLTLAEKLDSRQCLRTCIAVTDYDTLLIQTELESHYQDLHRVLNAGNHEVTMVYAGHQGKLANAAGSNAASARDGICLLEGSSGARNTLEMPNGTASYEMYLWLKEEDFDLVHFPQWSGLGYYALLAKHQGLAFHNTLIQVGAFGCRAHARQTNSQFQDCLEDLVVDFMERRCIELSDAVIASSQKTLDWLVNSGVRMPLSALVMDEHQSAAANADAIQYSRLHRFWQEALSTKDAFPASTVYLAPTAPKPLVSVCLIHRNRPKLLLQALSSIEKQDYGSIEVILVDDGSDDMQARETLESLKPVFDSRGWQLLQEERRYPGAARNTAANHAGGEFLLFMDDDNCAKAHEISTMVKVAQKTGADIVTCGADHFTGNDAPIGDLSPEFYYIPLGAATAAGIFHNYFGDANSFIRKQSFKALGGFSESFGIGHEDWELFARASCKGFQIEAIPERLFWYRRSQVSLVSSTPVYKNHMHSLSPYMSLMPEGMSNLLPTLRGLWMRANKLAESETTYRQETLSLRSANQDLENQLRQLQSQIASMTNTRRWKVGEAIERLFHKLQS